MPITKQSCSTHYQAALNGICEGLQMNIDEIISWSTGDKMILNESKMK